MAASRGGNFHAVSGELSAYLNNSDTYHLNGQVYSETVRSSKRHRLINGIKCSECLFKIQRHFKGNLPSLGQATKLITISTH